MSSKLSVEEVLGNLEKRAAFHRDQEAFHGQQEAHHREQRSLHAVELEKVLQSLESFRTVAAAAVDLAQPVPVKHTPKEEKLPPPGRKMVGQLLRLIVQNPSFAEPFGPAAVVAEANRRFADRLPKPVEHRMVSNVLRRMVKEGLLQVSREGKAHIEALYVRRPPRSPRPKPAS
jgi:hypothetical protein